MSENKHQFLWFGIETTGLVPGAGRILEWAAVLAADDLGDNFEVVQSFDSAIAYPGEDWNTFAIDPYVMALHRESGLWDAVKSPDAAPLETCDAFLESLVTELAGPRGSVTLAGCSPYFAKLWLNLYMPRFAARLSPWVFDVTTLARAAELYGREQRSPSRRPTRALPGVLYALERMRDLTPWLTHTGE